MKTERRLIDVNAEICKMRNVLKAEKCNENSLGYLAFEAVIAALEKAPTVDAVEVVHARWVDNHCTVCGMMPMGDELWEHLDVEPPKMEFFMDYCPCCGAKMDRGTDND